MFRTFFLVFCGLLGACTSAGVNTGRIDYRRADLPEGFRNRTPESVIAEFANECPTDFGANLVLCTSPALSTLRRKNLANPSRAIAEGEVYSIRLDYGVVTSMSELPSVRKRRSRSGWPYPDLIPVGEIAVLVQAFEFSAAGSAGADPNEINRFLNPFVGKDGETEGENTDDDFRRAKVVYFSVDVERDQPMNFSNIPVLGPVRYEGRPIGLQVIILELDRISEPARAVFKNLSDLGKSSLGSGPLNAALLDLGQGLVDGASQDDIIFEYRMVMDNGTLLQTPGEYSASTLPAFEDGRVVLRRVDDRQKAPVWRNLVLDENTGALMLPRDLNRAQKARYTATAPTEDYAAYVGETYLTFNIINHGAGAPEAQYAYQTLDQLEKQYTAYFESTSLAANNLIEATKRLKVQQAFQEATESLDGALGIAIRDWTRLSEVIQKNETSPDECDPRSGGPYASSAAFTAQYQARNSIQSLLTELEALDVIYSETPVDGSADAVTENRLFEERKTAIDAYIANIPQKLLSTLGYPGSAVLNGSKNGLDYSQWSGAESFDSFLDLKGAIAAGEVAAPPRDPISDAFSESAINLAWSRCIANTN